mgnify:CR=1 FL=1
MKKVTINNSKGLVPLLSSKCINHEVIQDGWKVIIFYTDAENLLEIGKVIGANLPDLVPTNK